MAGEPPAYLLSPRAVADLEEIWAYTAQQWSVDQAERYHALIIAGLEDLASGHKKGRSVDIRDGYIKYAVGSHVIFYRRTDSGLIAVRILHRRMDVGRHL